MKFPARIRTAIALVRTRASNAVRAARGTLPRVISLARGKVPSSSYQEPSFRSSIVWSPALIRSAEMQADAGNLRLAASLCEAMLGDDRVHGCLLDVRIRGLLGLPVTFAEGVGRKRKAAIKALEVDEDWTEAFPEDSLAEWMLWGILLGISIARLKWVDDKGRPRLFKRKGGERLIPRMEVIHPSAIRIDIATHKIFLRQADGSEIEITPGDGTWMVYTPYGPKRPWARGLWRGISRWWLLKEYAKADWGRYSERHGMGLWVGIAAEGANPEDRDMLAADLQALGRDSSITPPAGYSVELVESTANTWSTYQAQTNVANTAIAVSALGQNLTTELSGGSFAAASIHATVKGQIIRADDESSATTIHDQGLTWYAEFNWGDRQLAPWPARDTELPEDLAKKVETQQKAASSTKDWIGLGLPVDVRATAESVGVIIDEHAEAPVDVSKGEIFKYHLDYGVFTTNEIRASRGLPPIKGGDTPPKLVASPPSDGTDGLSRGLVSLASGDSPDSAKGFIEGQQYADDLAASTRDHAASALSPWIDVVLELVENAESFEDLKAELAKAYPDIGTDEFEKLTARAAVLAELAGAHAVLRDL
jgi:hypothetical protein